MIQRTLAMGTMIAMMAAAAGAGSDVMFAYKFEAGAKEHHRLKVNTEVSMAGMDVSQIADMMVTVTCVVAKPDANSMTLVFDKVDASQVIAGNMSTDPSAAMMVGKAVNFTVDSHGTVTAITPGPGFEAWPQVQQVVEPILKSWYAYLPGKGVPVGGEWKREDHVEKSASGSEYTSDEYFKFRAMKKEKGRELAVVDENMNTTIGGSTQTPMGNFALSGAGKGKFEFQFDAARGAIARFKGSMETDVDMTSEAGGDPMKTSVANTIERELIE